MRIAIKFSSTTTAKSAKLAKMPIFERECPDSAFAKIFAKPSWELQKITIAAAILKILGAAAAAAQNYGSFHSPCYKRNPNQKFCFWRSTAIPLIFEPNPTPEISNFPKLFSA